MTLFNVGEPHASERRARNKLAKRIPSMQGYPAKVTLWTLYPQPTADLDDLKQLYDEVLVDDPNKCLVLGHYIGGSQETVGKSRGVKFELATEKRTRRKAALFKHDSVHDIVLHDLDGLPYPEGYGHQTLKDDPFSTISACLEAVFDCVPDCLVVLSSKAGIDTREDGTEMFRGHVWVKVDEPVTFKQGTMWLERLKDKLGGVVDAGVYRASGQVYTARAFFDKGQDPFPGRRPHRFHGNPLQIDIDRNAVQRKGKRRVKRENVTKLPDFPVDQYPDEGREPWLFDLFQWVAGLGVTDEMLMYDWWKKAREEHGLNVKDSDIADDKHVRGQIGRALRFSTRQPQDLVHEEPTMSANEAQEYVEEKVLQVLQAVADGNRDRHPIQVSMSAGAGKTELLLALIIRFTVERAAQGLEPLKFVFLAPTHPLLEQICDRFEDLRWEAIDRHDQAIVEGGDFMDLREWFRGQVWKGKLYEPEKDVFPMCHVPLSVQAAQKEGIKSICKGCPHFKMCGYTTQQDSSVGVWFAPTALAQSGGYPFTDADVVIIDEDATKQFTGGKTIKSIGIVRDRPTDELSDYGQRIYKALIGTGPDLTVEEVEDAIKGEYKLKPEPEITEHEDHKALGRNLKALMKSSRYNPEIITLYRGYRDRLLGMPMALDVAKKPDRKKRYKATARWVAGVNVGAGRKDEDGERIPPQIILLNATPNTLGNRSVFGDDVQEVKALAHNRNTHVTVVRDAKGQRSQWLNPSPWGEPQLKWYDGDEDLFKQKLAKWQEDEDAAKDKRERVARWIMAQPEDLVLIGGRKETVTKLMAENPELASKCAITWYNATVGKDTFTINGQEVQGRDLELILSLDRQMLLPAAMEEMARCMFAKDENPIRPLADKKGNPAGWFDEVEYADGTVRLEHHDPRVQAMMDALCRDEIGQLLHRGRSVRRSKPLRVVCWHNVPAGFHVDASALSYAMWGRIGPLQLWSPDEIERVFGYDAPDITREVKINGCMRYWTTDSVKKPYSAELVPGPAGYVDYAVGLKMLQRLGAVRMQRGHKHRQDVSSVDEVFNLCWELVCDDLGEQFEQFGDADKVDAAEVFSVLMGAVKQVLNNVSC